MYKNKYKIDGDTVIVYLDRDDGSVIETKIDLNDLEKVLGFKYKWVAGWAKHTQSFYAMATIYLGIIEGKPKYTTRHMNNYIMDCPEGLEVDHEDHDTLNNKRDNLRISTVTDNHTHRKRCNKNNKTGYRNVCISQGKPIVQLQIDGKNTAFRGFETPEEANEFAIRKREELYKKYKGNNDIKIEGDIL